MVGPPALVRVERASKRFDAQLVLDEVTLRVRAGEALVLLGPSGCGKTTLLRLIAGLETPDGGVVELAGQVASTAGRLVIPPHNRGIGFVFQDLALWPHMTVAEHLAFVLEPLKLSASGRHERIRSVLAEAHAGPLGDRYPHQLSGGEQQRVAIARAIAARPRLLLLDEPLSSLDHDLRIQVRLELVELHRRLGLTVVAVTHDAEDARVLGQRVVRMRGGRIDGDADTV